MVRAATFPEIAGYPVVRPLGRTSRAMLLLSRLDGEPRVLRVFRAAVSPEDQADEIEARARVNGAHAAGLLDLATAEDGLPVAVLEHVGGLRLDHLLRQRESDLTAGEAVTLLVPLLDAVHSAHEVGVTFGGLASDGVRLRVDGAPVITRFRGARAGPVLPAHFRASDDDYRGDRQSVLAVAAQVVGAVPAEQNAALRETLARQGTDLVGASAALHECAQAQPISATPLGKSPTVPPSATELAVPGARLKATDSSAERVHETESRLAPVLSRLAVPESVAGLVADAEVHLRERVGSLLTAHLSHVRRRFAIVGAAGMAALLFTVMLVGNGAPSTNAQSPDTATAPAPLETESELGLDSVSPAARDGVDDELARVDLPGAPELLLDPAPGEWSPIVRELVARWLLCRAQGAPVECAEHTVQPGSSGASSLASPEDAAADALGDWAGSPTSGSDDLVVVQQMGSAVIVDLIVDQTTTASLLLMRSEAGWRVRDVLTGRSAP